MVTFVNRFALVFGTLMPLTTFADTLEVVVQGIEKQTGTVRIAVFDSEASFKNDGQPIAATTLKATIPSVKFTADLPAGQYAIKLMHDVDGDEKLATNIVGMPTEPFGFSNNARGNFGPPKWNAAAFKLEGNTTITIELE